MYMTRLKKDKLKDNQLSTSFAADNSATSPSSPSDNSTDSPPFSTSISTNRSSQT